MENNAVIKNGVGNISQAELAAMKEQMNQGSCQKTHEDRTSLSSQYHGRCCDFTSAFVCN